MQIAPPPGPSKVCPLVTRPHTSGVQLLAFRHPSAGYQFVKGGLRPGEAPATGALRELYEESGLTLPVPPFALTTVVLGTPPGPWHLFHQHATDLPDTWAHQTADDHGHIFRFFWHPLDAAPGPGWHPLYARLWQIARPLIAQRLPPPGRTS